MMIDESQFIAYIIIKSDDHIGEKLELILDLSTRIIKLVVPFQQLLEGPIEVFLCERVNDFRHSLFHLLNCLITTASELRD